MLIGKLKLIRLLMHIQSCTLKNGTCGFRLSPVGIAIFAKRGSVMSACAFRRVLTAGIAIYLLAGPVHAQTVGASLQGIVAGFRLSGDPPAPDRDQDEVALQDPARTRFEDVE